MDVDGMAHAPVRLQKVMFVDVVVYLLELSTPAMLRGTFWC